MDPGRSAYLVQTVWQLGPLLSEAKKWLPSSSQLPYSASLCCLCWLTVDQDHTLSPQWLRIMQCAAIYQAYLHCPTPPQFQVTYQPTVCLLRQICLQIVACPPASPPEVISSEETKLPEASILIYMVLRGKLLKIHQCSKFKADFSISGAPPSFQRKRGSHRMARD